jgi:hypothetical protein
MTPVQLAAADYEMHTLVRSRKQAVRPAVTGSATASVYAGYSTMTQSYTLSVRKRCTAGAFWPRQHVHLLLCCQHSCAVQTYPGQLALGVGPLGNVYVERLLCDAVHAHCAHRSATHLDRSACCCSEETQDEPGRISAWGYRIKQ